MSFSNEINNMINNSQNLIFITLLSISISFWHPITYADDDCDLLCQMGVEPITQEESNKNDSITEDPYIPPNTRYESQTSKQNNRFNQSKSLGLLDQNFIIDWAKASLGMWLTSEGTVLGEYLDINWGNIFISENQMSWRNLEVFAREETDEDFIRILTIKNMECSGYKIGTLEAFEAQITFLYSDSFIANTMATPTKCSFSMSADFVDDPVLLYELADEMELDYENDRQIISLLANTLKDMSFNIEFNPIGRTDHEFLTRLNLGGNIFEMNLKMRGIMSMLTPVLGMNNEFYYWLGFADANEFRDYLDSLTDDEKFEAYAAIIEQQSLWAMTTVDPTMYLRMMENFDIRSFGVGATWTDTLYRVVNDSTGRQMDTMLNSIKPLLINTMSKTDFSIMMSSMAGPEATKVFLDLAYPLYIDTLNEARMFVNNPRGLSVSIENTSNVNIMDIIESTEMSSPVEFIRLLSGIKVNIEANPRL